MGLSPLDREMEDHRARIEQLAEEDFELLDALDD